MKIITLSFFILLSSCSLFKKKETPKIETVFYFREVEESAFKALKENDKELFLKLKLQVEAHRINGSEENLLHASIESDLDLFKEVISLSPKIDQISVFSMTPLALAVAKGDYEKAKILLDLKAQVDHLSFLQDPIFFLALKNKDQKMLKLLMNYNFNPDLIGFMDRNWAFFNFSIDEMTKYSNNYVRPNKTPIKNNKLFNFFD